MLQKIVASLWFIGIILANAWEKHPILFTLATMTVIGGILFLIF